MNNYLRYGHKEHAESCCFLTRGRAVKEIRIGKHALSTSGPPYFIADIGSNHDGSLDRALKLVELAKGSGADAAKFQNFKADQLVSKVGFDSFGRVSIRQAGENRSIKHTKKQVSH